MNPIAAEDRTALRMRKACLQYGYDGGCIVPGCDRPAILHHFIPRRAGGTDAIANMISICKAHEQAIHAAGYFMRMVEEGNSVKDVERYMKLNRWQREYVVRTGRIKIPQ